jgi:hypothetical protein
LPAWPALYLLAAVGLSQITFYVLRFTQYAVRNISSRGLEGAQYAVLGIFLLLLILPAFLTYPYYLSYFNPLLGGPWTAPKLVKVGWGEGLDQVGRWLAGQPDAPGLRVGSTYASALAPFFPGKIGEVTAGGLDYLVLYRKQVQGGEPSPSILRYFQAEEPVHTVRLDGIDYAWIYAGPAMQPAMANEAAFDIGILPKPLAFRLSHPYLPIGQEATVEVLWLAGDELPAGLSRLTVQSREDLTRPPGDRENRAFVEGSAQLQRRGDGLVLSRHKLKIPGDLPRAGYGLLVDGRPLGAAEARLLIVPPLDEQLDADFGGQVCLVGYSFDAPTGTLRLAWQAAPLARADYTVFVHVLDANGNRVAGADAQPPVPASQWGRGEVIVDERVVPIPQGGTAQDYGLAVGLYRPGTGKRLPLLDEMGEPVGDRLLLPLSLAAAND